MKRVFLVILFIFLVSCQKKDQDIKTCNVDTSGNKSWGNATDFTLKKFDGKCVTLSDYKGKIILLDFWVSWCPICQMEMPNFVKLHNNYKNKGLVIIGICYDEKLESAKDLMKKLKLEYPVVIGNKEIAKVYKWRIGSPVSVVINKSGDVVEEIRGVRSYKKLENAIKKLL